jgi:hypothetical protein
MASEGQCPDEMRALERELRALVPRGPNIEMAKMMYRAGQASLSPVPSLLPLAAVAPWRSQWLWPVSTAATSIIAGWLAVMLVVSHNKESLPASTPKVVTRPDTPKPNAPAAPAAGAALAEIGPIETITPGDAHYFRYRQIAVDEGVEALPVAPAGESTQRADSYRAVGSDELRRELGVMRPRTIKAGW